MFLSRCGPWLSWNPEVQGPGRRPRLSSLGLVPCVPQKPASPGPGGTRAGASQAPPSRGGGQPLTLPNTSTPTSTPFLHHLLRAPQERPASKCGASSSTHTQGSLETGAKGRGKTIHDRLTFRPPHRLVMGRADMDQPILKTPLPPRHPLHPPPLTPAGPVRKATWGLLSLGCASWGGPRAILCAWPAKLSHQPVSYSAANRSEDPHVSLPSLKTCWIFPERSVPSGGIQMTLSQCQP